VHGMNTDPYRGCVTVALSLNREFCEVGPVYGIKTVDEYYSGV
jgi:hypothetical protein